MASLGIVVIGRNEARHLSAALASAQAGGWPVVYVDSDSSDGSVAIATGAGVPVVSLDPSTPLSAARARNAGFEALSADNPDLADVMFLDGDCLLDRSFPAVAARAMQADATRAVVVGHLHERSDERSIYGRLSAMEWSSATGEIHNFGNLGGIMLVRAAAFTQVGGFNETVIAGEDSEFGVRLSLAGWRVTKIDAAMASHDNGITGLRAWWRRSVRAGHALAQRYFLHGRSAVKDCRRDFISTLAWGGALPLLIVGLAIPTRGGSMLLAGLYAVIGWRMYRGARRGGAPSHDAAAAAGFGLLAKFANMQGVLQYARNRWRGSYRIIEYKGPEDVARA